MGRPRPGNSTRKIFSKGSPDSWNHGQEQNGSCRLAVVGTASR
ncbi:hypothetical protein PspLS_02187 [Pyricularia sp. CBS 133598]|nr:hypothetical protein PspLS_02187 [Pyricularia sp. CBS 133598]